MVQTFVFWPDGVPSVQFIAILTCLLHLIREERHFSFTVAPDSFSSISVGRRLHFGYSHYCPSTSTPPDVRRMMTKPLKTSRLSGMTSSHHRRNIWLGKSETLFCDSLLPRLVRDWSWWGKKETGMERLMCGVIWHAMELFLKFGVSYSHWFVQTTHSTCFLDYR